MAEKHERIMGIDVGEARVGVALSDPLGLTVRPLEPVTGEGRKVKIEKITKLVEKHSPDVIAIGFPLNMNGTKGPAARSVEKFMYYLKKVVTVPVIPIDERLTSWEAGEIMDNSGILKGDRKQKVDGIAAVLIVQKYLERRKTDESIS
ncbi:MAG: Holliday junction resolvase RuvX [Firmicutes bacterium]|nr:Holliday junction resolvase RuvX [Bacillota bacterium]